MTILVIEDDPGIRQVICEILTATALRCISFKEGKAALDYIRKQEQTDFLIFVDLVMPGMNGWEFLKNVKPLRKNIRMKTVVVTGIPFARASVAVGEVDQVIEKLFKIDSILQCVYDFEESLKHTA